MDLKTALSQFKQNPDAVRAVMDSQEAQELLRILQSGDGGKAVQQASDGNTAQLTQLLQKVMASPGGAELLQRIGGKLQK